MWKMLTLLFIVLLAIACLGGYYDITKKIIAGNLKIAQGEKQLAEGQQLLAKGKAKLAAGEHRLSEAKRTYNTVRMVLPIVGIASELPVTNKLFKPTTDKITEGDRQVARGKAKIRSGQQQLAEGKQQLNIGIEKLKRAGEYRITLAIISGCLILIAIALGIFWRKTIISFIKRK